MNFLRKHTRIIFIITIIAFISSLVPLVPHLFHSKDYIVKVNGAKISENLFNLYYNHLVEEYRKITNNQITEKDLKKLQDRIIDFLVRIEISYQQAKLYGITVTDKELKTYLQSMEIFKSNNTFDKQKYYSFLKSMRMTPKEYETLSKKLLYTYKLETILKFSIKLWNYEFEEALKQNPSIIKRSLSMTKANFTLNEWYSNIIKNSKITYNKTINKNTF